MPARLSHFSTDNTKTDQEGHQQFKSTSELKKALVKASLVHARTVGFNDQCIIDACRDHDLPPVSAGILKRGPIEVVDYAMDFWLQEMHRDLTSRQEELGQMRVRDRINTGIKTRLELVLPYKKVWPQAMALGAHPQNLPSTFSQIHSISDEVWFQAGDKAVDVSITLTFSDISLSVYSFHGTLSGRSSLKSTSPQSSTCYRTHPRVTKLLGSSWTDALKTCLQWARYCNKIPILPQQ